MGTYGLRRVSQHSAVAAFTSKSSSYRSAVASSHKFSLCISFDYHYHYLQLNKRLNIPTFRWSAASLTVVVRHADDVSEHVRHGAGRHVRLVDVTVHRHAVRVVVTDLARHRHARLAVLEPGSTETVGWCQVWSDMVWGYIGVCGFLW